IVVERPFLLGLILACFSACSLANAQPAEQLYFGGSILTMKGAEPEYVEALAVRQGRIIFAGRLADAKPHLDSATKQINLQSKTLLPGFIDGHSHLLTHAEGYLQAPLSPPPMGRVNSIEDIIREVKTFQKEQKINKGEWIIGSGYDQNFLREQRHPTARDLDAAFPDNPVVLLHASGHMLVANSRAFEVVRITAATPDPAGGAIIRLPGSKEPEGLVQEMAVAAFTDYATPVRERSVELKLIEKAVAHYASFGITTAAEHLVLPQKLALIQAAAGEGLFSIDVVATPAFMLAEKLVGDAQFRWRQYDRGLKFSGIKVAVDGSPQGKTAFLTEPYLTRAEGSGVENRGFANVSQKDLNALFNLTYQQGVQMYAHCNGDAAVDMVIQAHREAMKKLAKSDYDHRTVIIHSQIMRSDQLDAYRELKLFPTFFTNHVFYWGETHRNNLGVERANFISPLASARRHGVRFSNHTDNTVTPIDPLFLLWTSVARRTRSGAVLGEAERVSAYEGLRALTADAAYEYFEESLKGTLEVGKLADLVILDANPLQVATDAIKEIRILETIKAGQVVFRRQLSGLNR
ncbi:MAG: amidohydrolase, partial [Planctomycetota bacterium]